MSWSQLPHQTLASVTVASVSMILFFWMGRALGPEAFGGWNVVFTWAALGMLVVDGGFRVLIFREEAGGVLQGRIVDLAFGHWLVMALIALPVSGFFFPGYLVMGAVVFVLASVAVGYRSAWLKAMGSFKEDALWQVKCRFLSAAVVAGVLIANAGVEYILWAWALGLLLCLLQIWPWLVTIRPVPDFNPGVYRPVAALLLIDAATVLYLRADILMLEWLGAGHQRIGLYVVAARVLEGVALLSAPVAHIFFRQVRLQWLAGIWQRESVLPLMAGSMCLGIILTGAAVMAGDTPWQWLLGPGYEGVGSILPWLLGATVFMLPNALLTQVALAIHGEWKYAMAAMAAALANILLNLWWIPVWDIYGAAMATVAAEALLMCVLIPCLGRRG
ncbi:MAG: polysaccharide biosynthesis C-terminal domain-containing protein [Desulfamplus sp.]|nr:polysaccharide biosynthesis C-terminal domain-containing protein [Desulfamplus sp.]